MRNIAIVTDSNTGMSMAQAAELGIYQIPMTFTMNGVEYQEEVDMTQEEFFAELEKDPDIKIGTSQPAVGTVTDLWDSLLKDHDEIVHIPMSSALSGTVQTARMLAEDYGGRVRVVDNQRISGTLRYSAIEAKQQAKNGLSAAQIGDWLEETRFDCAIRLTIPTLKYLKAGGRITPAAAAIGTLLRIRPVLQIKGEKVDAFAKARTLSQAESILEREFKSDMENRFKNDEVDVNIIQSNFEEEALRFKAQLEPACERAAGGISIFPLSLSVACHIGPGCIATTYSKVHKEIW